MNILGATKAWQVIILLVLLIGLGAFGYLWITEATTPATITINPADDSFENNTYAQMSYRRMYIDHYGETTIYDTIGDEVERLRGEQALAIVAAEVRIAAGEEDVKIPSGRIAISEDFAREHVAALGQSELTATVELNLSEAVIFAIAIIVFVLYLFYLFVLEKGKSVEVDAPDHA